MIHTLKELLEYQKVDIELRKLLDEIEKSGDGKKMDQAKAEFNAAKVKTAEAEKAAESIVHFYNNSTAYYEENSKKIDEIASRLSETEEETERKELVAQLETLKEKFADLEKKLAERREKSDTVIRAYLEANNKGKKMREIYAASKSRLDGLKAEKESQLKELRAKLDVLRQKIDPELFKQYSMLTSERKYPAVVPAIKAEGMKNFRCFCGLTLSQKTKSELIESGGCRCETCRRILYIE